MLMQNTLDGSVRDIDPSEIPQHKAAIWQPYSPPAVPLDDVKAALCRRIDAEAEQARLKYITPGAGQALTYDRKRREALTAIDDQNPSAESYPLLAASVGIEGADIKAVAQLVMAKEVAWAGLAGQIERVRLGAKKAVKDGADRAASEAAAVVEWP